jgi:hypothetical protein
MSDYKKARRDWEQRFPALTDEWTHWWIEGDGALLAVVGGSDLGAALDIVETHHDQCPRIVAYYAKVDSFGEVVREEKHGRVIAGRNEVPPGDRTPMEESQCCFCGRVLGQTSDTTAVIERPGSEASLRCHSECLRARLHQQ